MIGHETLADEMQSRPPIYFVHGIKDDVVPISGMVESQITCGDLGIETESHHIGNLGHIVDLEMIKTTDRYIKEAFAQAKDETPSAASVNSIRHTAPDKPKTKTKD